MTAGFGLFGSDSNQSVHHLSKASTQLPEGIDFVDADFVSEENPDVRGTLLDIKFTNQANQTAFVKHLILNVKKVWHLRQPPILTGAFIGPSARYEVKLDESRVPYKAKVIVSHSVNPGESDRFLVLVKDVKQWSEVYAIYRFSLELVADGNDQRRPYKKDFLVFFSEYSNKFPSLEEALAPYQLQNLSVEEVKKVLGDNRSTLHEIVKEDNCTISPALLRFMKSAESP